MNKEMALMDLKLVGWLMIVIGIMGIFSEIIGGGKNILDLSIKVIFWTGIAVSGWIVLSSRKVLI